MLFADIILPRRRAKKVEEKNAKINSITLDEKANDVYVNNYAKVKEL